MIKLYEPETKRLKLRQWQEADFAPFAAMNADAAVMEYYPSTLTRKQSDAMAEKVRDLIAERGWGLWAVETKAERAFIGYVGLHVPGYDVPNTTSPCVEIGWRLAKQYWHRGYATEAARAALDLAFGELGLDKVYSFTALINKRSEAVMQRLGMENAGQNFGHPNVPEGHALHEHCLYMVTKEAWVEKHGK